MDKGMKYEYLDVQKSVSPQFDSTTKHSHAIQLRQI